MTSILKVSEIQDPTNSNTALTIDSSGEVLFPQSTGSWNFSIFGDTSISSTSPATTEYTNVGTAYYTKIGDMVTIWTPSWNMASLGLSSGGFLAIRMSLPFTAANHSQGVSLVTGYNLRGRYSTGNLDGIGKISPVANTDYAQFGWNTTDGNGSGYVYLSGTGVSVEGITFSYPV
jgi:hypothetical protein